MSRIEMAIAYFWVIIKPNWIRFAYSKRDLSVVFRQKKPHAEHAGFLLMLALNNHIFPALEYVCFLLAFSVSLVAVNGGYSLCCAGASCCGGLSCCGAGALGASASVVAACGSWSMLAAVLWLTDLVALQCVGSSQTRDGTRVFCITRQIFFFF